MSALPIFGGIAGGLLAGIGQSKSNKAISETAEQNIEQLQQIQTQVQADRIMRSEDLSRQAQSAAGLTLSSIDPRSLSKMEAAASTFANTIGSSQYMVNENARRQIAAARHQQQSIANQAGSQMGGVGTAAFSGALGGIAAGAQFAGALDELGFTQSMKEPLQRLRDLDQELANLGLNVSDLASVAAGYRADAVRGALIQKRHEVSTFENYLNRNGY